MLDSLTLVWGTTLKFLVTVKQSGVAIDITNHRLVFTAKLKLTDADPGIAQFDNRGAGVTYGSIVPLAQSGSTLGQGIVTMLDSVTRNAMANPTTPSGVIVYFNILDNDGASDVYCPIGDMFRVVPNVSSVRP